MNPITFRYMVETTPSLKSLTAFKATVRLGSMSAETVAPVCSPACAGQNAGER